MRISTFLYTLPLLCALAPAQHTILFIAGPSDERTLALDAAEVDLMRSDEIYSVTPAPGIEYPARPFLPISLQYHYAGDLDSDGIYVEDDVEGPVDTLDAVFIKAGTTGPVGPRDVYFSLASTSTANIPGLRVSDVLRYSGQGTVEFFLTQLQINDACGYAASSNTINLDAICQSAAGDIFFSQSGIGAINGNASTDGDLYVIPSSAITYDVNGNVSAITPASAVIVATEADLVAMAVASGHRSSVGGAIDQTSPTPSFELSGLEVDPNGGTWTSPVNAQVYPNLLWCWSDFNNDGSLISTAGGGTITTINGVSIGSTVATLGDQLGVLPDSTGINGPGGFALIPAQAPTFTLLNWPRNQHTASWIWTQFQLQTSGGTPGAFTILAWSVESSAPGGTFPALPLPGLGELGMSTLNIFGIYANDALGNCSSEIFQIEMAGVHGVNLACQALDFTTFTLSTPSAQTFL